MLCSSAPAGGVSSCGELGKPEVGDLGRRQHGELAVEFERVGNAPRTLAQLVGELDADRQPAFELVGRAQADHHVPALAPFALRMLVMDDPRLARAGLVGGGRELVLDGGIDPLDERQGRELRELERARRPRDHEARLRHIHVQPLAIAAARAVDDDLDVRLGIAGIEAQELLMDRAHLGPGLVADEADRRIDQILARLVGKRDRPRLQLRDRLLRDRRRLDDLEVLRRRRRSERREPRQQGDGSKPKRSHRS